MKDEAQKKLYEMVREHEALVEASEKRLVEFALEHNLYLSLGDYGQGRTLLLSDDSDDWGSGKKRGEWLYSSETC